MKTLPARMAALLVMLTGFFTSPAVTADAAVGAHRGGPLLELGGRPGFRPYYRRYPPSYGYRPYYGYSGSSRYYGYQRPPHRYDEYRFVPRHKRPPYYYERPYYDRYYDYPRRPPYRSYQGRPPGWGGDPRFQPRYRR
ncbi:MULTISPECIES: hypothetical protein [Methylobacter]|uniref:hypothetical protein n=1 Tax=Methylobacter TaxID=429 RepID=UPI00037A8350|nr:MULTISPECIES: hypothetical protein [Methylobacter]